MSYGRKITGTRDEVYDLISVLYHTLQAAETYVIYTEDADFSQDKELVSFFQELQEEDKKRAERAKELLRKRLLAEAEHEDISTGGQEGPTVGI